MISTLNDEKKVAKMNQHVVLDTEVVCSFCEISLKSDERKIEQNEKISCTSPLYKSVNYIVMKLSLILSHTCLHVCGFVSPQVIWDTVVGSLFPRLHALPRAG